LWGFIRKHSPDASPEGYPLLDDLVGYAVRYYEDFVKPTKQFRTPTEAERKALVALSAALAEASPDAGAEQLQGIVYEAGKQNGFADSLRDWFKAIYEVLLGQSQGPRFGGFIELYGVAETRALIDKALKGELVEAT
jgi:lysyl-tRNA synthetase class 1